MAILKNSMIFPFTTGKIEDDELPFQCFVAVPFDAVDFFC